MEIFVYAILQQGGLCVPPKCIPINPCEQNPCLEFVEGDLLEQSIQPLELCTRPKTIKPCCYDPVEDPTPADEAATKTECDNCL